MSDDTRDTREKLLDAAEALFAGDGFDAVSIRDIAAAADVNVAAVNYHFHSKDRLYLEVLRRVVSAKHERFAAAIAANAANHEADLDTAIRTFYRAHFEDVLKTEAGGHFLRLLVREMHHGSAEGAKIIQEQLQPMWADLAKAILASEPGADPAATTWIMGTLHGQLIHFTMRWQSTPGGACNPGSSEAMRLLFPPLADDVDQYIDLAVDHITRFSVAGIRAVIEHGAPTGSQPVEGSS